jgi:hypothetical protein
MAAQITFEFVSGVFCAILRTFQQAASFFNCATLAGDAERFGWIRRRTVGSAQALVLSKLSESLADGGNDSTFEHLGGIADIPERR